LFESVYGFFHKLSKQDLSLYSTKQGTDIYDGHIYKSNMQTVGPVPLTEFKVKNEECK
jgi:hypothetical protein